MSVFQTWNKILEANSFWIFMRQPHASERKKNNFQFKPLRQSILNNNSSWGGAASSHGYVLVHCFGSYMEEQQYGDWLSNSIGLEWMCLETMFCRLVGSLKKLWLCFVSIKAFGCIYCIYWILHFQGYANMTACLLQCKLRLHCPFVNFWAFPLTHTVGDLCLQVCSTMNY